MNTAVGFIGLGRMGLPMAQHLLGADFSLSVFNRTASRADVLLQHGAQWAASPRALAEQSDVVVSMIADDAALRAIGPTCIDASKMSGQCPVRGMRP